MAPRRDGAPHLNAVDMAVQHEHRVQGLKDDKAVLVQVQLRPPLLPESPGQPGFPHKIPRLAKWLALTTGSSLPKGKASASKAPSGTEAPSLTTSASADHYPQPLLRRQLKRVRGLCNKPLHQTWLVRPKSKSWAPEPIYDRYIPASAHISAGRSFALCQSALAKCVRMETIFCCAMCQLLSTVYCQAETSTYLFHRQNRTANLICTVLMSLFRTRALPKWQGSRVLTQCEASRGGRWTAKRDGRNASSPFAPPPNSRLSLPEIF